MTEQPHDTITTTLLNDLLREKRSERRWKNIRFTLGFVLIAYMFMSVVGFFAGTPAPGIPGKGKYAALIRMDGMIAPGRDLSAEVIIPALYDAFSDKNAAGVVIDINSPGGTPVQSSIIHDTILAYKKRFHKRVVVVGEDMLTSGAYFVAVSADKIYVNPNTLTGSIGVIMKGFGFVDAMKKVGIERRVYTVGADKDRLDPFLPQTPEDLIKIQSVMNEVHQNFVNAVMEGRKGKLRADAATLFNGDFWSGQTAVKLGLVDELGNLLDVLNKEFGTTRYREYGESNNFFKMLSGQFTSALDSMAYFG